MLPGATLAAAASGAPLGCTAAPALVSHVAVTTMPSPLALLGRSRLTYDRVASVAGAACAQDRGAVGPNAGTVLP